MSDVLKMIKDLADRQYQKYGDPLSRPYEQEEVHMTYYVSKLLEERGHVWFKSEGVEGACYTEKAMQDAFTAGRRIGQKEAVEMAENMVRERVENAMDALHGR